MADHQLTSADYAVIEQALREAMNRGTDYREMIQYRDVLTKMQGIPISYSASAAQTNEALSAVVDGFRYDYDDSAGI